jgi:hypothetical protein
VIEKVWAKANGNYDNIVAGTPSEAINFLTGAPSKTFTHSDVSTINMDGTAIWNLANTADG